MNQPIKTLRQIVIENCALLLVQHPELKGELRRVLVKTFEKGLLIAAFQFSRGSKKRLSNMLGISYPSVDRKIREHDIRYLGTFPKDQSYLSLIDAAYGLNQSPLSDIERAVIQWVFLYCLSISPIKFLYDAAIEEIDIPLIAIGFREGKTRTGAARILGMSRVTLNNKMKLYGIKAR
jgi:DNA-binding protein Fis